MVWRRAPAIGRIGRFIGTSRADSCRRIRECLFCWKVDVGTRPPPSRSGMHRSLDRRRWRHLLIPPPERRPSAAVLSGKNADAKRRLCEASGGEGGDAREKRAEPGGGLSLFVRPP